MDSGQGTSAGGRQGSTLDFLTLLQAWLEKHKKYPGRSRQRREQGTALLYFVMDRQGRVLEYRLRRSSGHDRLDEAVIAMIKSAQPLPGLPTEIRKARLELVIPVRFLLR